MKASKTFNGTCTTCGQFRPRCRRVWWKKFGGGGSLAMCADCRRLHRNAYQFSPRRLENQP